MNNKQRTQLVDKIDQLRGHMDENPFLKAKYNELENRINEVYQEL